jgi:predicted nucleic acid-binding protein
MKSIVPMTGLEMFIMVMAERISSLMWIMRMSRMTYTAQANAASQSERVSPLHHSIVKDAHNLRPAYTTDLFSRLAALRVQ